MAYVPVPKDLSRVKPKVMFNLTKRQLVCFGAGVLIGLPLFFLMKSFTGVSAAAIVMILSMMPFFMFGMYEKDGQPLEAVLNNALETVFLRPKQRPYRTVNLYAEIIRLDTLEREVQSIVRKTRVQKTHAQRKKANRRAD